MTSLGPLAVGGEYLPRFTPPRNYTFSISLDFFIHILELILNKTTEALSFKINHYENMSAQTYAVSLSICPWLGPSPTSSSAPLLLALFDLLTLSQII